MLEIGKRQLVLFNARRKLRASVATLIATSSLKQTLMKLRVRYDLLSPTRVSACDAERESTAVCVYVC
jgi:hypothetical protein